MAKKKDLATVQTKLPAMEPPPSYIAEIKDRVDMSSIAEKVLPPRLKIVQAQSTELKKTFDVGDLVLLPGMEKLISYNNEEPEYTPMIPIYMFTEFCKWLDFKDPKGKGNPITERTFDPNSDLANLCRDPDTYMEDYGKGFQYTNSEHICFIVYLPEMGQAAVLVFRTSGYAVGRAFCTLLKARNAAMVGCQFALGVRPAENVMGNWFTYDVKNPPGDCGFGPWVSDKATVDAMLELHTDFEKAHQANKIHVDYGDESESIDTDGDEAPF